MDFRTILAVLGFITLPIMGFLWIKNSLAPKDQKLSSDQLDDKIVSRIFPFVLIAGAIWLGNKCLKSETAQNFLEKDYRETNGFYYWFDSQTDVCMVKTSSSEPATIPCTHQIRSLFNDRAEKEYAQARLEIAKKDCKKSPTCTGVYLKDNTVWYQQKGLEDFNEHDLSEAEEIISAHGLN
jgi:hypothetical protein